MNYPYLSPHSIWARLLVARTWELLPGVRGLRRAVATALGEERVLEIGCGFGMNAPHLRGRYAGWDVDEKMIAKARELHPDGRFVAGDVGEHVDDLAGAPTVLFSLVLHELPGDIRERLLDAAAQIAAGRILVFDFNPEMSPFQKRLTSLIEEESLQSFWDFRLADFLAARGWSLHETREINRRFCMWRFVRRGQTTDATDAREPSAPNPE